MWVIIEKSLQKFYWISGVFLKHEDALEYLSTIPDRPDEIKELREIPAQNYPVMFFNDFERNNIIYVTPEELTDKLLAFEKVEDEDHQYCIYYTFQKDHRGFSPDEEYYAWVNHHHVENSKLESLIETGIRVDSVEDIQGIYRCINCHRLGSGILSEKGYEPPRDWQIILQPDPESKSKYMTVCSEDCKLTQKKEWEEYLEWEKSLND